MVIEADAYQRLIQKQTDRPNRDMLRHVSAQTDDLVQVFKEAQTDGLVQVFKEARDMSVHCPSKDAALEAPSLAPLVENVIDAAIASLPSRYQSCARSLLSQLPQLECNEQGFIQMMGTCLHELSLAPLLKALCVPFAQPPRDASVINYLQSAGVSSFRNHRVKTSPENAWKMFYSF